MKLIIATAIALVSVGALARPVPHHHHRHHHFHHHPHVVHHNAIIIRK